MSFYNFLGTTLGSAYIFKWMPGTSSSLFVWILLGVLKYFNIYLSIEWSIILSILTYLLGYIGIKDFSEDDPKFFTLDETFALILLYYFIQDSWLYFVIGFILFRFFDATKVLGIKKLENITKNHRLFSIYIDDFVAGLYTLACIYILKSIF